MPVFEIQNMCGNSGGGGGTPGQSPVSSVNGVQPGANGNVQLDPEKNLGAALMALNWSSYSRLYATAAAEAEQELTPEQYLMAFAKQGCRFVRTASGLHFGVTAKITNGLIARGYIYLPSDTTADCKAVAMIGNTELMSFTGTIDALEAEICGLPIATRLWTRNNTGWVDVAAGWEASSGYTADASCKSDAVKTFLWTLDPGRYMLRLTDGIVYLQAIRAAGNAVRYRWLRIYPNEGHGLLTALYDVNNEVWARGIAPNGGAFYRFGGSAIATQAYVNTRLETRTTPTAARKIANEQILEQVTQPFNDALVGVSLQKYTEVIESESPGVFEGGRRCLKLNIENAAWLLNQFDNYDSVSLHLMICSRRRGRGYHWWHPKNYDFTPAEDEPKGNKIGYGVIAGKPTNREEGELFPAVPSWMPHNGLMQTEIAITRANLTDGYVLIYPDEFFLPMIKPVNIAAISVAGEWQRNIAIIGTEDKNPHALLCGWVIAIDGVELGRQPLQEYRFGANRKADLSARTAVLIDDGVATISGYYSSISIK